MSYSLDTNTVIALLKDRDGPLARRMMTFDLTAVSVSAVVMFELWYGAFHSARPSQNLAAVQALRFPLLDLTAADARAAGELRVTLRASGQPIGPYDLLIAGQALARGLTVVTANTREFARVNGLRVEDWSGPSDPSA